MPSAPLLPPPVDVTQGKKPGTGRPTTPNALYRVAPPPAPSIPGAVLSPSAAGAPTHIPPPPPKPSGAGAGAGVGAGVGIGSVAASKSSARPGIPGTRPPPPPPATVTRAALGVTVEGGAGDGGGGSSAAALSMTRALAVSGSNAKADQLRSYKSIRRGGFIPGNSMVRANVAHRLAMAQAQAQAQAQGAVTAASGDNATAGSTGVEAPASVRDSPAVKCMRGGRHSSLL
jgi:hypothetical protein